MGSKKEEERNEKIIRGLLKLPPNRRCINCNTLGPQYVCPNFWSFVCITCSGIHREFTHRVKSVSMAKFTSQEVEALQNGGNQRAREIYLKNWDLQRQRLPDSSNVDKIRQFIKDVYVDKKYATGQTSEKPPRDTQNHRIREDDTRRASSYHSFSQSPPYDYQYEDRRYGKQAGSLTRKPGSDRGRYEGKTSGFVYSPGRQSERMYDDEGSVSRVSDYSASSTGDPFRSGTQSPNFQKDMGFGSPPISISRDVSSEDVRHRAVDSLPQRSRSVGSFGSIDGQFMSQRPSDSVGFTETISGSELAADFFKAPIDLFQLPEAPAEPFPVDFFQASSMNAFQPVETSTTLNLFAVTGQPQSTATSNEGWATFDLPQTLSPTSSNDNVIPTILPTDDRRSLGDLFSSADANMQWPASQDSSFHSDQSPSCNEGSHNVTSVNPTNAQLWNAFGDSLVQQPLEGIKQDSVVIVGSDMISSTGSQNHSNLGSLESANVEGFDCAFPFLGPSYNPPPLGQAEQASSERKSNNPFDLPYDSELGENDMFLDMTSFHSALPDEHLFSSFGEDVSHPEPWITQKSASPYVPAAGQGRATFLIPQAPTPQIPNVSTQGSLASPGGNPFA